MALRASFGSEYIAVLRHALVAVERALHGGEVVNTTREASAIVATYGSDQWTVDEVAEEIARMASERGVPIQSGPGG